MNMATSSERRAVVLLSGGLDSSTALAATRAEGYHCYSMAVDYGQRHQAELEAAQRIARQLGAVEHRVMKIDLAGIGGSALTDRSIAVPEQPSPGIPVTYVPARNTIFLALALAWAEVLDADAIVIGVNAVDYSGYPDCRPEFIAAFAGMANLATRRAVLGQRIELKTPLIDLTKAQIVQWGAALGVDYALTVSCYQADLTGAACGRCDSCRLRAKGFSDAGLPDPTRYA
ncbi:MAG TPA: 7-cyano-7-deazaguanine synthase QueC [Pseudomonadales bacterium]|jgi:7-cyano-7-deazaguanine synthase|nr:7-cyano-7-deazaguanine synthase QueC [Pseudomonadales bacterium]HMZ71272.1 7-cyano-7-deazaguanine synthase QueC [Pseudomonadales bacterium]HNH19891.1 7-cyano-7-deazaguanine synthase QueC [Pseudomonadales bacterium]